MVADVIEGFVLEIEEHDRIFARIRGRVDAISMKFPKTFTLGRYLTEQEP